MNKLSGNDVRQHQRWLIDNGLINDMIKDNLYLYGAILHVDIQHVELAIDVAKKNVSYQLYVTPELNKALGKYAKLRGNVNSKLALWRLKRMLSKHGNLDFNSILNLMVKDFCGHKWSAKVEVRKATDYEDGFERLTDEHRVEEDSRDDKQPDR